MYILLLCVLLSAETQEDITKPRVWTSADGQFSVEATFQAFTLQGLTVSLQRVDNGQLISISVLKLSETDQALVGRYYRGQIAERRTPQDEWRSRVRAHQLGIWEGFRGLSWGTYIDAVSDMEPLSWRHIIGLEDEHHKTKYYTRKNELLRIGEAKLLSVTYVFYKDRFYSVFLEAQGVANWVPIRDAVFARYGEGTKFKKESEKDLDEWYWSQEDVCMILSYGEISKIIQLSLTYEPICDQEQADKRRQTKEAAATDF